MGELGATRLAGSPGDAVRSCSRSGSPTSWFAPGFIDWGRSRVAVLLATFFTVAGGQR